MKIKTIVYAVLLSGLLLPLLLNCKKEAIKTPPTVTISVVTNIASTTANSGGEVTSDGGTNVTERGVCWSVNQNPTTSDSKIANGKGIGSFTSSLEGLAPGTIYNVKAYAINSVGTSYSSQSIFTTIALAPVLTTTELTGITSSSATGGGNITNDGGSPITSRGVCWSTNQNPTIADIKTSSDVGTGSFAASITGLLPGKTYYFRAFATNSIGTAYGNQVSSIMKANLPILNPTTLTTVTATTALGGGNITSDGGATITARGVCWSINQDPTIADSKTNEGTGLGIFTTPISGLTPSTHYYFRVYATNSAGTAYGTNALATTMAVLPVLTTSILSAITETSASSGGNITNDGGSPISSRGICWSMSQSPTIADSKTISGTGIGIFAGAITGLAPGATYYVRAFATNSIGTAYGEQITLIIVPILPVITTKIVSSITSTTAISGANIVSEGGTAISACGLCWGTTQNPTINNSKSSDRTGLGSFTSNIVGLVANTTYFIRAYATNNVGTAYGNELIFKTLEEMVTDIDGNVYHTVTIGTQVWMVENLKTTKYNDDTRIPNVTDTKVWGSLTIPVYCWYENNSAYKNIYGALYNFYTVNTGKLCPIGWHVPSDVEWTTLTTYLGESLAGSKLKEEGTTHWWNDTKSNNISGFTALPGGLRGFDGIRMAGYWWSTTADINKTNCVFYREIDWRSTVQRESYDKKVGMSVRCIKD